MSNPKNGEKLRFIQYRAASCGVETADEIPERVSALKEAIVAADGLLLATPEYNNSMPGVFKNAVDWLSRPPADIGRVFGGKPVAVLGASPGGFGTILSQNAWLPRFAVHSIPRCFVRCRNGGWDTRASLGAEGGDRRCGRAAPRDARIQQLDAGRVQERS
jgi:hypothetical protein